MRLYVSVTDNDWFALHASKTNVEEVNFWRPSPDKTFKVLQPGELLLFKPGEPADWKVTHFASISGSEEFLAQLMMEMPELVDAGTIYDPERQKLKEAIAAICVDGLMPAFEQLKSQFCRCAVVTLDRTACRSGVDSVPYARITVESAAAAVARNCGKGRSRA